MRRTLLLSAALVASLASAPPAEAQERDLRIRHFDAELRVRPDGALEVTETLQVEFRGAWNGILRDLSLQHRTAQGRERRLRVSGLSAYGADGARLESSDEEHDSGPRLRIRVPDARDAVRTVVVRYRVDGAIRFFYADSAAGDFDELYWNATGNLWEMPIDRATARVILPEGAAPLQAAAYTGYAGSTESAATIAEESGAVAFASTRSLAAGEGMTVAVGWPAGAISTRPSEAAMRRMEALRLWPLGLPLLAFVFALGQWRRRGRDPEAQAVVVGYEPPEGMSPAELGTLIDHRADLRDITSTVVDLAVRGHVGIEEEVTSRVLGLLKNRDYAFHLRHPEDTAGLAKHEARFVAALNQHASSSGRTWGEVRAALAARTDGGGAPAVADRHDGRETRVVRLGELKERFYTSLPGIRDAIYERLVERGYYRTRPDRVKAAWIGGAIGVGAVVVFAGVMAGAAMLEWVSSPALIVAGLASAIVLLGFGAVMPARTEAGARAREAALGFREFLARVETDRYRRMITSPDLFERYLPHAMAFGVAERWAKAFEGLYQEAPEWYAGGGMQGFRATAFASDMVRMNSAAQSTMSSSPSSSGSGSGGGGSSGGGSGGGGGGGW